MRRTRVYIDAPLALGASVALDEATDAYLTKVLRLATGAVVHAFSGDGHDYRGTLVRRERALALAIDAIAPAPGAESPLAITLAQALARGDKMDLILQKATELGVAAFRPIVSERSEVKLDAERAAARIIHWQRVVASACEQSGRAVVPQVAQLRTLARFAGDIDAGVDQKLVLDPDGTIGIDDIVGAPARLLLASGPEGGFSDGDLRTFDAAGFVRLRLGPRVLRAETAGLAALAALQARYGDLGR